LRLKIDAAKSHVDHVYKLCDDRQAVLLSWLDEVEADVHSQCQEAVGDNPEQLKKQKENAAVS
jgi:hypothetical protein